MRLGSRGVQALEPARAFFERGDGGDERLRPGSCRWRSARWPAGYSPAEAQEPCRRIWRDTTFCSGSVICGEMLPMSVTVPPLRVAVDGRRSRSRCEPTASRTDVDAVAVGVSAESASGDRRRWRGRLSRRRGWRASCRREASTSATKTRAAPGGAGGLQESAVRSCRRR